MWMTGCTAVVTGAASGIGFALARSLTAGSARVIMVDKDAEGLCASARELGGTAVVSDVASVADNEALAEMAGVTRVLCLNAGVVGSHDGPVWLTPPDQWAQLMATNVGGVVNGLRAFVPRMIADGEPHNIVITASLAGLATWPGGGAYAASKHAVVTVAEQAALSLAGTPVTVTLVCPALVRSGMSAEGADPGAVAAAALDAAARGIFAMVPPQWTQSVMDRSRRLSMGQQPQLPSPM